MKSFGLYICFFLLVCLEVFPQGELSTLLKNKSNKEKLEVIKSDIDMYINTLSLNNTAAFSPLIQNPLQ